MTSQPPTPVRRQDEGAAIVTIDAPLHKAEPYRLARWLIDPGACRISDHGQATKIEPRAMAVLSYLAAHPGRTISRDELLDEIWKTRHVVEEALTKCISQLRQALADDSRKPTYIETIPKLGYRLLVQPASHAPETAAAAGDVQELSEGSSAPPCADTSTPAAAELPKQARRPGLIRALVATLSILALAYVVGAGPIAPAPEPVHFPVALAADERLVEFAAAPLAVPADGRSLIFALSDAQGSRLWRRDLDSGEQAAIVGTEGATSPFLSPDGQWIAFAADGKIKRVSIAGGDAQVIANAEQFFGGCWLGNETIIFAPRFARGLWRVSVAGGKPEQLTAPSSPDAAHIWPTCLPDARTVLYSRWRGGGQVDQSAIGFVSADGREQGSLLEGGFFPRYLRGGHLLFVRVGTLMVAAFDVESRELRSEPRPLVNGVLANFNSQVAFFETSGSDHLALIQGHYEEPERRLVWIDRAGAVTAASSLRKSFSSPRIAPNGRHIALLLQDDDVGVWLLDTTRGQLTRISHGLDDHSPVWSPDGQHVAFDSGRSGQYQLYVADIDQPGGEAQLTTVPRDHFANAWLPDGRLVYTRNDIDRGGDVFLVNPGGSVLPEPLLTSPFSESQPSFSADGRWMAFVSDESGRKEVYVQRFPPAGLRTQVSRDGGEEPLWSRTANELFFRRGAQMFAVQVDAGVEPAVSEPQRLFSGSYRHNLYSTSTYDVADDGRFLTIETPRPPPRSIEFVRFAGPGIEASRPIGRIDPDPQSALRSSPSKRHVATGNR